MHPCVSLCVAHVCLSLCGARVLCSFVWRARAVLFCQLHMQAPDRAAHLQVSPQPRDQASIELRVLSKGADSVKQKYIIFDEFLFIKNT